MYVDVSSLEYFGKYGLFFLSPIDTAELNQSMNTRLDAFQIIDLLNEFFLVSDLNPRSIESELRNSERSVSRKNGIE